MSVDIKLSAQQRQIVAPRALCRCLIQFLCLRCLALPRGVEVLRDSCALFQCTMPIKPQHLMPGDPENLHTQVVAEECLLLESILLHVGQFVNGKY
jgi:hypothetical protein